MPNIDYIILAVIGGFGLFGMWFGLVSVIASLAGTTVGFLLAMKFYEPLADWLMGMTKWTGTFPKVVMFIISFLIIERLVGLVFKLIAKALGVITDLPVVSLLNRLTGLLFGLAEGALIIGIVFYYASRIGPLPYVTADVARSNVIPACVSLVSIIWPLIPTALNYLKGIDWNWFKV